MEVSFLLYKNNNVYRYIRVSSREQNEDRQRIASQELPQQRPKELGLGVLPFLILKILGNTL